MANAYLRLGNENMYFQLISLSQQVLNELKTTKHKEYTQFLLIFEHSYYSLELWRTRSPHAAENTIEATQKYIGYKQSSNLSLNLPMEKFVLGLAEIVLGNTSKSRIYLEQAAVCSDRLPYAKRAQEYLKTGDERVLWK